MISRAAVCPSPPLLARELTGADPVLPELRQACLDATAALLTGAPDLVAVVGVAGETRRWSGDARLDLSAYAPGLGQHTADQASLPLSLGLGARLLDQAGYCGQRDLYSLSELEPPEACAALGARLASADGSVALLVMADGSARRGLKAPGYFDERSGPFDAQVEHAIRAGNFAALLALDAGLARDLMASGRPAWQALAGAMSGRRIGTQVRYCDDPFGVAYIVASVTTQ